MEYFFLIFWLAKIKVFCNVYNYIHLVSDPKTCMKIVGFPTQRFNVLLILFISSFWSLYPWKTAGILICLLRAFVWLDFKHNLHLHFHFMIMYFSCQILDLSNAGFKLLVSRWNDHVCSESATTIFVLLIVAQLYPLYLSYHTFCAKIAGQSNVYFKIICLQMLY